jgi:glycosyltransferase involved in cell wall biosynthesis
LERQKGFDLLLRAWAKVQHQCPDWSLRIVGSGSQEPILKDLMISLGLEPSVQLAPFSRQIEEHYRESSVFVCSSRFEGFGLVLAEAKAAGLPVVSFDCRCGPSEIVRHNYDGLLVKAGKSEQLAAALRVLICDEQKRVLFSSRASADHRFDGEQILNDWEDLLASTGGSPLYDSSALC